MLRLLANNTIEEHILDVAEQKRKFADSSITGAHMVHTETADSWHTDKALGVT